MEETRDNKDTDNKDNKDNMDTDKGKTTETVKKPKKKRCSYCKKKLGMISFTCQCHGTFCVQHQSYHSHECPHINMIQESIKQKIKSNNPKVEFTKLVTI